MDGLMAVSPLSDAWLKKMRPGLAMFAGSREGANALIDLDHEFGLHPAFAPLAPLYREGRLAVVHGIGSPNPTRSHEVARGCLEESIVGVVETTPAQLNLAGRADYGARTGPEQNYTPGSGVEYPRSVLGDSLKQIAALIKAGDGLEIALAESTGWDTHVQQAGTFAELARDLSSSISAFWKDVESHQDRVVLVTMTEFGRTVHENGSLGTDHGRASCVFVLGNQVDGGKVHGRIPELDPDALQDGRDLPVTTDFRAVFSEVASKHLSAGRGHILFPGWSGDRIALMKS
jgi:uncharacterized protein (DUF1501 family)